MDKLCARPEMKSSLAWVKTTTHKTKRLALQHLVSRHVHVANGSCIH